MDKQSWLFEFVSLESPNISTTEQILAKIIINNKNVQHNQNSRGEGQ